MPCSFTPELICRYCHKPPEACDAELSGRGGDIVTREEYEREQTYLPRDDCGRCERRIADIEYEREAGYDVDDYYDGP